MNKLPVIQRPVFEMLWPSKNKMVNFKQFLVKEEKILLMALQGESTKEIIFAIKQILNNCILDEEFNPEELTTFDLDYMFIKLRSKSINNIINISYIDEEDEREYKFEIDLEKIELTRNENHTNKIKINDDIGIIMKYPSVNIVNFIDGDNDLIDINDMLIIKSIDKIYDNNNVYIPSDFSDQDLLEFIDSLSDDEYKKIEEFFSTMPKLYYKIEYKNSNGNERVIELKNLNDFFILG